MYDDEDSDGLLSALARLLARVVGHAEVAMIVAGVSTLVSGAQIFGETSKWLVAAAGLVALAYWALTLFSNRFTSLSIRISILGAQMALKTLSAAGRTGAAREVAISISYLESVKKRTLRAKIGLLLCSVLLLSTSFAFPGLELLDAAATSSGVLGLLFLRDALLEYRIRNGFFGTSRSEAKDLVEYLVSNSEDIDFTDGSGKLRRALEPEKQRQHLGDGRTAQDGAIA